MSKGTMNTVSPRCFGTSTFVRVRHRPQSDHQAPVVQTFEPFRIHSSPSRTAVVCAPATSDPPLGSDSICIQISSPRRIAGTCWRFCSSVPKSSRIVMHGVIPGTWRRNGYCRPVISSLSTRTWSRVRPCPPYSRGTMTPASPPS